MAFRSDEAQDLLARRHRRCCICHRFCGVKMELDHIDPKGDGGSDDIENAIPVCFECHAEIHLYNEDHPRGRKFRPAELRRHKEEWLQICREHPEVLVAVHRASDVGPIQALIDELEFNLVIATGWPKDSHGVEDYRKPHCGFETAQFDRAMAEAMLSLLGQDVKDAIYGVYSLLKDVNGRVRSAQNFYPGGPDWNRTILYAGHRVEAARPLITSALALLRDQLGSEK